jgi:hypothetical protein
VRDSAWGGVAKTRSRSRSYYLKPGAGVKDLIQPQMIISSVTDMTK